MDSTERRKRKSGSSWNPSGNYHTYIIQTNPLLIDTVLARLFSFADYETLKEYRLVCSKWKLLIDPTFIRSSVFASTNYWKISPEQLLAAPEDIPTLFTSVSDEFRFTAFKFQVNLLKPIVVQVYVKPNLEIMTQLEVYNIRLGDSKGYNIDELLGPNLQILKLTKMKPFFENNPWVVSLEAMAHIPKIELTDCLILIDTDSDVKMAPTDLKLNLCRYRVNDSAEYNSRMRTSDMIDFRFMQNLCLQNYRSIEPFVSFRECAKVPCLTLMNVTIDLNGKISPRELTLRCNRYTVHRNHIQHQFLLNDYLTTNQIEKIVLEDERIVFDNGQAEANNAEGQGNNAAQQQPQPQ